MTPIEEMAARIAAACPPGWRETAIPRLGLMRAEARTAYAPALYDPVVCFAAQGRKRIAVAGREYDYDPAQYLVVAVDLPAMARIVEASPQAPYLAARLRLDPGVLNELILGMPGAAEGGRSRGIGIGAMDAELADAVLRLLRLVDRPAEAAALAPLVEREILYRLLLGPQGAMLRQIALADSRLARVGRAIAWIRQNFDRPLRVADLADLAAMSPATLHRRFRAVTAMSPLQYQKHLRLHEARRRLVVEGDAAQTAGFGVGYESPSQFSREYARLFGTPPARDGARIRGSGAEPAALERG
ncbi:MAG: AraC family transcriptional regulator [Rhodobacteraceae bacterium]|nr:AraC family transcriptional regulator [Paracoccaceae bacterium]